MTDLKASESQPDLMRDERIQQIAWRPTPEYINHSRIKKFMDRLGIAEYDELLRRSQTDIAWFWDEVVKDLGLEWYEPYNQVVDLSRGKAWATWFVGGKFNYVHNAVDRHAKSHRRNKVALITESEDGTIRKLTYRELYIEVNRLAAALHELGVTNGDCVGLFMPMIAEAAIASLACSKIGAIYTPIFSGFAPDAVAARLNDCQAKLLITADGFTRRGKPVDMKSAADAAVALSPSIEHVLVFRRLGNDIAWTPGRDVWWHESVAGKPKEYPTEVLDAEHPFMIGYTSGTTGRPKGSVHTHAGFCVKAVCDYTYCFDVQDEDVLFWLSDMGWIMGPLVVFGAFVNGSTLLFYDGTPDYPNPDRLWEVLDRHGATIAGTAPTAVRTLKAYGDEWVKKHDLSALRILGATGEPWDPEAWLWYFHNVGGGRCPIINYSGGTEIAGGILCCTPLNELKPCSFAGPIVGMAADVIDEQGNPVRGDVGELAVRQPWPGMTRGFWKDPDRYIQSYWSRIPDVWVHGDWALVDEDGFWFILGRSDDTIKVAGKRIGPAEIESAAMAHPDLAEVAAIGVPHDIKGEGIILFAIVRPGVEETDSLREAIRDTVAQHLGKAMRPESVHFVSLLPKTRSAKILRRIIRAKHLGRTDLGDLSSIENPAAVDEIAAAR